MGNKISISFEKNGKESVTLFSHWQGIQLKDDAEHYINKLLNDIKEDKEMLKSMPLGRLEPGTVMVDFIRHITKNLKRIESDFYLGKSQYDGDNSDNGHHRINL